MRKLIISIRFTCYCAGDKIERNEIGRACGAYVGGERHIQVLMGKPDGKKPMGRPRHIWDDDIKINLQELRYGSMDWTELAQDRDISRHL
jgi:hypothetical protein